MFNLHCYIARLKLNKMGTVKVSHLDSFRKEGQGNSEMAYCAVVARKPSLFVCLFLLYDSLNI